MENPMMSRSQDQVQADLLTSFKENCMLQENLQFSGSVYRSQSSRLCIPEVRDDQVEIDHKTSTVRISEVSIANDSASATSITRDLRTVYTFDEIRKFPHDFPFGLISTDLDRRMVSIFDPYDDGYDKTTPDLFIEDKEALLVLEFSTTRNDTQNSLEYSFSLKRHKYLIPLQRRVASRTAGKVTGMKYGYSCIALSDTSICFSSDLNLDESLINEMCARFRFASNIQRIVESKGVVLGTSEMDQMKADILHQVRGMIPIFEDEGSTTKLIPMSKERIITDDVTELDSLCFTNRAYRKQVNSYLKGNLREQTETPDASLIWMKLFKTNIGGRMDKKAVLQIPGSLPCDRTAWEPRVEENGCPLIDFWHTMLIAKDTEEWNYEDTIEDQIRKAMEIGAIKDEKEHNKRRRMFKRVRCDLTEEQELEFAKVGVQAKSLRDNAEVLSYREAKSEAFSLHTQVDDVEEFVNDFKHPNLHDNISMASAEVIPLIEISVNKHENVDPSVADGVRMVLRDPMMKWCSFITDMATELSISLRQNVGRNEFVVKFLKKWDAILVIKPTNSDSHVFYTIVMKDTSEVIIPEGVSKRPIQDQGLLFYPWMSYSISRLVNAVKVESFYLTMMSQWSRYYALPLKEGSLDPRVQRKVRLCLLVHLEDRPKTEELFTLFRYISMEKFSLVRMEPLKMLEKIPTVLWSRLQVWVLGKLINEMASPPYEPTVVEAEGSSKKSKLWDGMFDPYTHERVADPAKLIELYYIGYATNKDAKSWRNTEFDLAEKIIKYEEKLTEVRKDYCGMKEDPEDGFRIHEWSRKFACAGADSINKHLSKLYSKSQYKNRMQEKLLERLSKLTWEDVATLRASSTFDPGVKSSVNKSGHYMTKRVKVVIAVLRHLDALGDTPALSIGSVLDWVDKDGGLRVDIFKKNQHGGLREIYVLEIRSRILQLFLETISRTYCFELPIEMMMHPENKISRPQEHMYRSAIDHSAQKANISSSNDAKVWNQGHHVAKFAQIMCRILPDAWAGLIVNGLRQWTDKRIALPDGIMDLLDFYPKTQLYNPIHSLLRDAYVGVKDVHWIKRGQHFMQIQSGMMQGILHYMSSLVHCCLLMLRDGLWRKLAEKLSIRNVTMDLVSSDDSSRMTDIFSSDVKGLVFGKIYARADHLCMKTLSTFFGIHMSPKSTMCTNGVMEFNSEYFFRASLIRPTLKWSYAALNIVEVESLVERQEVMYNLVSELLEGGSGFRQASETQFAQAFLHYKLMGSSINPLFSEYSKDLVEVPDPALGFFLMDNPICAGMPGFNYNLWNITCKSIKVNKLYSSLLKSGSMSTTTSGQIIRGIQCRFGNRQKAIRLVEECDDLIKQTGKLDRDWREEVELNPEVLYKAPRDLTSAMIKMMVSLTSPGVMKAMGTVNSLARMIASSVYMINGLATSIGSNWLDLLKESKGIEVQRVSLWMLMSLAMIETDPLSYFDMRILFPQSDFYTVFSNQIRQLSGYVLSKSGSTKMLRSQILVFPEAARLPFTLEQICRDMWFGEELPASRRVRREIFSEYQRTYKWLDLSVQQTLINASEHFESHIQLRNFIARQGSSTRIIHLTGAPVRDVSTQDLVISSIIKNQLLGFDLVPPTSEVLSTRRDDKLLNDLACILEFPLLDDVLHRDVITMLTKEDPIWDGSHFKANPRRVRLALIQHYLNLSKNGTTSGDLSSKRFSKLVSDSRLGVMGGFSKKQVRKFDDKGKEITWGGEGTWSGVVGQASVNIYIRDDKLVSLFTNSVANLIDSTHILNGFLKEIGVKLFEAPKLNDSRYNATCDLSLIRFDGIGAPIYEVSTIQNRVCIQLKKIILEVNSEQIRLFTRLDDQGSTMTIVSYRPNISDFTFLGSSTNRTLALRHWTSNTPIDVRSGIRLLELGMAGRAGVNTDSAKFKKFVSQTLVPSLMRKGWRFMLMKSQDVDRIPVEPDLFNIEDFLNEEFEDIFDLNIEDIAAEKEVVVDASRMLEEDFEFEAYDWVVGDLTVISTRSTFSSVRRFHKFWDLVSNHFYTEYNVRERTMVESFVKPDSDHGLVPILEYYVEYGFSPERPQENESFGNLEMVNEEW
ncbi:RNA-dependent RNA polymerase [Ceraphron bunya-like virus]|uniref:RNA-directed RNA polymerase L n=1 Tax=Ceraphron bunya-like virus TaxID=2984168 RepID=A0A9N6YJR3_9VIRU|nr:RNA-dependent RNA polymerase [Ceraphron bunya-like virus]DAZ90967.1 TPA_asm: RNA-dependent RNA polymerase [Ceraphron bunya-like virus]